MKVVSVALREDVSRIDHQSLREELVAEPGIHAVFFEPGHKFGLTIEYDPGVLSETQLLDSIYRHGVYPEPVSPRRPA
jgi:hypothetical protein